MHKFIGFVLVFFITAISVHAADMRFVQIDDMFYSSSSEESIQRLENVINNINKQKNVQFVIFTGNNIAKPDKSDLESLLETAKQLKVPYYIVLGNKDVNKQKDLSKAEYMKIVSKNVRSHKKIESPNYVIDKKDIVFIIADGSKDVIPASMGYYKADVLKWLEEQLNIYADRNVVIIQHFPLVPPEKRESRYTFKADEYLKLISRYKNVKAVISGHFNANSEQEVNGILHITTADAPVYRIIDIIDCDTSNPSFWSTLYNAN